MKGHKLPALTERQRNVLDFCIQCVIERQSFPTTADIVRRFKIRIRSEGWDALNGLEKKGYLKRIGHGKTSGVWKVHRDQNGELFWVIRGRRVTKMRAAA